MVIVAGLIFLSSNSEVFIESLLILNLAECKEFLI